MTFSFGLVKIVSGVGAASFLFLLYIVYKKNYSKYINIKDPADKSWGILEDSLKKRAYEVSRLINLGDAYIKDQCPSLDKLKSFSRRFPIAPSPKDKIQLNKTLPALFNTFLKAGEAYDEIKKHHYFTEIQNRVAHINADIDKERLEYNYRAENFNTKTGLTFFRVIMFFTRKKPYELFIIPQDSQKITDVKFDFPMPPMV